MAQILRFKGITFKINPKNPKQLLFKKSEGNRFRIYKNFDVNLHDLLCSHNLLTISTEVGFINTLNPFSNDWLSFTV